MTDQASTIQGKFVASINERYVAQALTILGFEFEYQYQYGLVGVRGSQSVDFLVYTVPKPTPLWVHGRYFHSGAMALEDELKMAEITSVMRGHWSPAVIVWEEDSMTVDDAVQAIRKELML